MQGMHKQEDLDIYGIREEESTIDEIEFTEWKTELQKTLPSFWESMSVEKNKMRNNFFF